MLVFVLAGMHSEVMHVKALCQQTHNPPGSIYRCHASCEWRGGKGACFVLGGGGVEEEKASYSEAKTLIPLMCCRRLCS